MQNTEKLIKRAKKAFERQSILLPLWQDIADNFYPWRSDFRGSLPIGENYADHLMDSYPIIAHRELSDAIGATLRTGPWFELYSETDLDRAGDVWMDDTTQVMRKWMTGISTGFTNAVKECDSDWTAFGHGIIMPQWDRNAWNLLYQAFHPRDCAFEEAWNGEIDTVYRKYCLTAEQLVAMMGKDNVHPDVARMVAKGSGQTDVKCQHIQIPTEKCEQYIDGKDMRKKYQGFHIDLDHDHVMQNVGIDRKMYVVPRWRKVSGSPYAFSPAITAAIPDARLMQAMTWTLLEAGEKIANPPMIATQGAVRSDLDLVSNGVTWVDRDYDERLGDVLRPLSTDGKGLPFAMNMKEDVRNALDRAMYLTSMQLPVGGPQMTAEEIRARMDEFIRKSRPLFDPVEKEYNGELCNVTFDILMQYGIFGDPREFPESVKGQEMMFRFRSPINEAEERGHGVMFMQAAQYVERAAQLDPSSAANFSLDRALRDAISGSGAPEDWLTDEKAVAQAKELMMQNAAAEREMELAERTAASVGAAGGAA